MFRTENNTRHYRYLANFDGLSDDLSQTCQSLLEGDVDFVRKMMKEQQTGVFTKPDLFYVNATKNCDEFKSDSGFTLKTHSQEEEEFPLAFSVLLYRDVEQFARLLRAVYRPQNVYCIHVDAKANETLVMGVEGVVGCFDNVFMASQRITVEWGRMSVLEPELVCMRDLLNYTRWRFESVIFSLKRFVNLQILITIFFCFFSFLSTSSI